VAAIKEGGGEEQEAGELQGESEADKARGGECPIAGERLEDEGWEVHFWELDDYRKLHGHACPGARDGATALYTWVKKQRLVK
jgi:hypothetical protein